VRLDVFSFLEFIKYMKEKYKPNFADKKGKRGKVARKDEI
jgi:hypothetical protein